MSKHHARIKNDPRWHAARAACLERDEHACTWPGCESTEQLEADHILELADHPELAFDVDNLRTLCRPHHIERGRQGTGNGAMTRNQWVNDKYRQTLADIVPVL